jgi:hypothetical protein
VTATSFPRRQAGVPEYVAPWREQRPKAGIPEPPGSSCSGSPTYLASRRLQKKFLRYFFTQRTAIRFMSGSNSFITES